MALLIAVVAFGFTVGALYFLIQKWRVKEIARRKRRALLAAGLKEQEESAAEDGDLAAPADTTGDIAESAAAVTAVEEPAAAFAYSDDEAARLTASLCELMQEVLDKESAYLASVKVVSDAHDKWDDATNVMRRSFYYYESTTGQEFESAVTAHLEAAETVTATERRIVEGLKEILPSKGINSALAALARELKKTGSYKPAQLQAELAGTRLVAQLLIDEFVYRLKRHAEKEAELRKKVKSFRIGNFKIPRHPVHPDQEAMVVLAPILIDGLHKARAELAEYSTKENSKRTDYRSTADECSAVQRSPIDGTRAAFDRCFAATEKPFLTLPQKKRAWLDAVKERAPFAEKVLAYCKEILDLIARMEAVPEATASYKLTVARAKLSRWTADMQVIQNSEPTKPTEEAETKPVGVNAPALVAVIPAQVDRLKDRMAACLSMYFAIPRGLLEERASDLRKVSASTAELACPEKPNDQEVGKLLDKLDQWSRLVLAEHRRQYQEYLRIADLVDKYAGEVDSIGKELEPLLALLANPLEPANVSQIEAAKLVQQLLAKKLADLRAEVVKYKATQPPVPGQPPSAPDTVATILEELRAASRSFGFAAAQCTVASNKNDAAKQLRPPACSSAPVINLVATDLTALVTEMEQHFVEADAFERRQDEINQACASARAQLTARAEKKIERRTALRTCVEKAQGLLNVSPSEDLYLATHAAKKLSELFPDK